MAAGLMAEPRRRASASTGEASASQAGQAERQWADALLGRLPLPCARAAQAENGRGPADFQRAGPVSFK